MCWCSPPPAISVIIPMVGRGEAEIGITNIMEAQDGFDGAQKDLRLIAAVHALRTPFFVRKDFAMRDDRRSQGQARGHGLFRHAQHRQGRARHARDRRPDREADVKPVLVPNVVRSADDFVAGSADMFFFAFGAPKVREVDATVGGIRVLEIDEKGMPAARKIMPWGYLTEVGPGPIFIGVEKPMKVYSFDNMIFTNAKVPDEFDLQDPRHAGEEQGRPGRRAAGAARIFAGLRLQAVRRALSSGRIEILQGA